MQSDDWLMKSLHITWQAAEKSFEQVHSVIRKRIKKVIRLLSKLTMSSSSNYKSFDEKLRINF